MAFVDYYGDGGASAFAQFNTSYGLALDTHGNFYVADYNNFVIRLRRAASCFGNADSQRRQQYRLDAECPGRKFQSATNRAR